MQLTENIRITAGLYLFHMHRHGLRGQIGLDVVVGRHSHGMGVQVSMKQVGDTLEMGALSIQGTTAF